MTEKQQQLLFDKGITNVPSDMLCSDNALAESVGMVYDNGEHRVIQKPKEFITGNNIPAILYVHRFNNEERYIGYTQSAIPGGTMNILIWFDVENGTINNTGFPLGGQPLPDIDKIQITSIGKTLVITLDGRIEYALWKDNGYEHLGDLPSPKIECSLTGSSKLGVLNFGNNPNLPGNIVNTGKQSDNLFNDMGSDGEKQEEYNNLIVGLYEKNQKAVKQKKGFNEPFFVRAAVKLYDDTYTLITQPILMLPFIDHNHYARSLSGNKFDVWTGMKLLWVKQKQDYTDWSDIVKDVTIFISDGVSLYDVSVDQNPTPQPFKPHGVNTDNTTPDGKMIISDDDVSWNHHVNNRDAKEIDEDIASVSLFYKLCDIGIKETGWIDIREKIQTHTLENLTTQEQLGNDDYYSRNKLVPGVVYAYNSRLNLANVSRGFFEGYDNFLEWDNDTAATYKFYVTIKTDSGEKTVYHETEDTIYRKQGIYFYYPDSRASHVIILKTVNGATTCVCDEDLTEHSGLNGAYYFRGLIGTATEEYTWINPATGLPETESLPLPIDEATYSTPTLPGSTNNNDTEVLPNYIITSEANNPFVFKAEGYYKVGNGKIVAMSSITQALSEGQFGQYPLLAFSTDGIWALSVASTGYYSSIHPMSREVCCEDNPCVVQTDGAVFFASEKGLMVVVGNQVKCVSEQLLGKESDFDGVIDMGNFHDYLKDCFIAYDYRDSLLWIFNNETARRNRDYCYVYSIKSGTYSKYHFNDTEIIGAVNKYPDFLIQDSNHIVYSLLNRNNINQDGTTGLQNSFSPNLYSALMITRPMKLENGLALKSIMQIKNVKDFAKGHDITTEDPRNPGRSIIVTITPTVQIRLFASNNLTNWTELSSLRGTPWKYYRIRYDFNGISATDRFSGSMLITQERRTDKLR